MTIGGVVLFAMLVLWGGHGLVADVMSGGHRPVRTARQPSASL